MPDAQHPIHAYKAQRLQARETADAALRAKQAAALRELHAHLASHAGDEVAAALRVELHPHMSNALRVHAKDHLPVVMRHHGGKSSFGVRRGRGFTWFDQLADALIHGQPLTFPDRGPADAGFDTHIKRPGSSAPGAAVSADAANADTASAHTASAHTAKGAQ